jgi:hypothetical protein
VEHTPNTWFLCLSREVGRNLLGWSFGTVSDGAYPKLLRITLDCVRPVSFSINTHGNVVKENLRLAVWFWGKPKKCRGFRTHYEVGYFGTASCILPFVYSKEIQAKMDRQLPSLLFRDYFVCFNINLSPLQRNTCFGISILQALLANLFRSQQSVKFMYGFNNLNKKKDCQTFQNFGQLCDNTSLRH